MASKRIVRKSSASPPTVNVSPSRPVDDEEEYDGEVPPELADEDHPDYPGEYDGDEAEIREGWGASQETIDSTSNYAQAFRPSKDMQFIRFLQPKPYASFRRHWIERPGIGKRAYTCLQSVGKECPLCDVGDKPGAVTAFNIALLSDDGTPVLKSWECAVKLTGIIKTYANQAKLGPLNRSGLYFSVIKSDTVQRQQSQTNVNPVRGRDLEEDWQVKPITEAQEAKLLEKAYKADIVDIPNLPTMEAVAAEFAGGDVEEEQQRGWGS